MALQSSGQISLSQIAAEFGGSAPHALSEYYGDGNAPSSGEIQLAADFYGTSAALLTTTIISGRRETNAKLGIFEYGFSTGGGTGGVSYGSIGTNTFTDSAGASKVIKGCRTGGSASSANGQLTFQIGNTVNYANWTSLTLTRGGITATVLRTNLSATNFATYTQYNGSLGVTAIFANNVGTTFILQ